MNNYTVFHLHSDLSNGVTNIDSVTKYGEYVDLAKSVGMSAIGFSEHGSVFEWYNKKCKIEENQMKYIHGEEFYLTKSLDEKVRDNFHCVLIAKNFNGFKELNKLSSVAFNRIDNHFYYTPRISFDELFSTSDNIIITSACVGGTFGKGGESEQALMLDFFCKNKDRCFLEVQHHNVDKQKEYNKLMLKLSNIHGLNLIAGTDTHCLNKTHELGRTMLQRGKGVFFDGEDGWDLKFKTYEQLCECYNLQGVLSQQEYLTAIENTNKMASMVEEYIIDTSNKYPKIYNNPEEMFEKKVFECAANHPYLYKNHKKEDVDKILSDEINAYKKTKSTEFMLLQSYLRDWEKENGIECGYSRGSVSGSLAAYAMGITQMDSLKFDLNFFRFINPDRISLADVDSDYNSPDRDRVKEFLLKDGMGMSNLQSSEIITFNTIALKGAIRDICRAFSIDLETVGKICEKCEDENELVKLRKKYSEIFEYVDIVNGTIVSIGSHPSGVLVTDRDIAENVGYCSLSASKYPVSMLDMKELDAQNFVKLDLLGLDNIGLINETCKLVGIDRLTPDNTPLDDKAVWDDIKNDTTMIFQWESNSAQAYLRQFMSESTIETVKTRIPNFSMIKWLSFGNGLIRPACASFRKDVAEGKFYDNGLEEINEFLAPEAGHVAMQESIMQFLVKFCGYSNAESDIVRRGIAKKKGTEKLIPEIEHRFIEYTSTNYNISKEKCAEVIKPFIQVILDASAYAFSWNHSDSYSCLGYICGYLRHYYPEEFVVCALNIFSGNEDKTASIAEFAAKRKIKINNIKFRYSKDKYFLDKTTKEIYKGIGSVKFLNESVANELYDFGKNQYTKFSDLVIDIKKNTSCNSKQLDILTKLDFFSEFGNSKKLLMIIGIVDMFKSGDAKKFSIEKLEDGYIKNAVEKFSATANKNGVALKQYSILDCVAIVHECEDKISVINVEDFTFSQKAIFQQEFLGYISIVSGKESDRAKLYIKETYPVKRKKDGKVFGQSIIATSIGSGRQTRYTIFNKDFERCGEIIKGDIIICKHYVRNGEYFNIDDYEIILQ